VCALPALAIGGRCSFSTQALAVGSQYAVRFFNDIKPLPNPSGWNRFSYSVFSHLSLPNPFSCHFRRKSSGRVRRVRGQQLHLHRLRRRAQQRQENRQVMSLAFTPFFSFVFAFSTVYLQLRRVRGHVR